MKRLLVFVMIFVLFSCKSTNKFEIFNDLNYIVIIYIDNYQFTENSFSPIAEINNNHTIEEIESAFMKGCNVIDKDKYLNLIKEIKKINLINNNIDTTGFSITINIFENRKSIESYEFHNLMQMKRFIEISDSIVGKSNYVPWETRMFIRNYNLKK